MTNTVKTGHNAAPERGRFIVVEGGEGAGKTTHCEFIAELIRGHGKKVITSREPGGTELGEEIRRLLLYYEGETIHPMAELLMIFAARAQHLEYLIKPELKRGSWVVCERFTDSSYAYQGAGRKLGSAPVATLEELVQQTMRPDLCLLFELPLKQSRQRVIQRDIERTNGADTPTLTQDRFESEQDSFHQRVNRCYHDRALENPDHYRIIDAGSDLHSVQQQLRKVLLPLLQKTDL